MLFGNEETFSLIGRALVSGSEDDYKSLCDILYNDIFFWVNRFCPGLQEADKEDIVQEVIFNVLRNLPRFYIASKNHPASARSAYLKTITHNECMDFFRRKKTDALNGSIDIDDAFEHPQKEDFSKRIENKKEFYDALKKVFSYNTSPDKLLAFVFKRLLWSSGGTKGSPKEIIKEFNGKPLQELYERMISEFNTILDEKIPKDILDPLKEKIELYPDMTFSMSEHQIADDKWIIDKLKEKKDE